MRTNYRSTGIITLLSLSALCLSPQVPAQGTVVGWGNTTVPAGLTNVVAISAGYFRAAALKADGTVVEWPPNGEPAGLTGVIAVAEGNYHTLALKADGTVVAWGWNNYGQCTVPAAANHVVGISAGSFFSLAVRADGTVVQWGQTTPLPAGLSNVIAVSAGFDHSLALKSDGTVVAWGSNSYNQCSIPNGLGRVVALAAGRFFSMALRSDGSIVAWGGGISGFQTFSVPNVVAISACEYHGMALSSDGTVATMSSVNFESPLVPPAGLNGVTAIAQGGGFCIAGKLPPTTVNHSYEVGADGSIFASPGVLLGAGSAGSAVLESQPQHGLVDLGSDGAFSYIPDPGFYGADSFTFEASNFYGTSNKSTASISVEMNLRAITLSPVSAVGGTTVNGSVLAGPIASSSGASVSLSSNNAYATVPPSISLAPGSTIGTFKVTTLPVDSLQTAAIKAVLGTKSLVATLTIQPAALIKATFGPSQVVGGNPVKLYVYLNGKAGPSGTKVAITSWMGGLSGKTILVPAGQTVAAMSYTPPGYPYQLSADATAICGGVSKTCSLLINLATMAKVAFSVNPITGGNSATCTVTLNGDPGIYGTSANLSSDSASATVPLTLNWAANARTATFTIQTAKVAAQNAATITIDGGTRGKLTAVLTINP